MTLPALGIFITAVKYKTVYVW